MRRKHPRTANITPPIPDHNQGFQMRIVRRFRQVTRSLEDDVETLMNGVPADLSVPDLVPTMPTSG
jgi:hypothetical protein